MKWLQLVQVFAPLILSFIPRLAPLAPFVSNGIQEAEQLPGASSAEKQAHAIQIARNGIASVNAVAGHPLLDPTISDQLIGSAVNTVVSVTNLVHAAHTGTPAPAA